MYFDEQNKHSLGFIGSKARRKKIRKDVKEMMKPKGFSFPGAEDRKEAKKELKKQMKFIDRNEKLSEDTKKFLDKLSERKKIN